MPQVDIETLVSACAGGSSCDRKIACETLADGDETDPPERHLDSPPESIWLSKDEEFDWWDRNAVYQRKDSTKGHNANSNSTNLNPSSNSSSQRFSRNLKTKAAIIGLPKPQRPSFVDAKNRHNQPRNIRWFPKRSASVGKLDPSTYEPSSPKVSCMGRVRSKRDRKGRLRNRQTSVKEKTSRTGRPKLGFFESLRAIFRRRDKTAQKSDLPPPDSPSKTKARDSSASLFDESFTESAPRNSISESEPPGLGGMKRFVSGRRSESWVVGDSETHVPRQDS